MKTFILSATLISMGLAASAQDAIMQSKFTDNMSITLKGGAATPLNSSDFWGNMRGVIGLDIRKQITPAFGMGIDGEVSMNTGSWYGLKNKNFIEHQLVGTYGALDLGNLFWGDYSSLCPFGLEVVAGVGWLHYYAPKYDSNSWYTKTGLNFYYNFGDDSQWTLSLKPEVVWNMNGDTKYTTPLGYSAQYSSNQAALQILAGITYHFGNSNGTHGFVYVKPYDYDEVNNLNAQINGLREELEASMIMNVAMETEMAELAGKLETCMNKKPEVIKDNTYKSVRYVFFKQGSSIITNDQLPNVEQIATYLKKYSSATVVIKGYASPEGSAEINAKIATARADAVKTMLVNKYGINASRIDASGQGVGDMFAEPTWNRVSICTINEGAQ